MGTRKAQFDRWSCRCVCVSPTARRVSAARSPRRTHCALSAPRAPAIPTHPAMYATHPPHFDDSLPPHVQLFLVWRHYLLHYFVFTLHLAQL
ncbi:hypothetical protein B5X24_HaOG209554 [Helicoverpa armigera]|uniref:Uncharacterized protein n=1 Tax=Helicoverpa armigera TaxID=29058 RepID=A0A2W1BJF2_HELAM|nr:hypothetical protein B5X24_HaOG209554 [Helicoverpa armigera]